MFSAAWGKAYRKYVSCGKTLFMHTDEELDDLCSDLQFEEVIDAERQRRKHVKAELSAYQARDRYNRQKQAEDDFVDHAREALRKAVRNGDTGDWYSFVAKWGGSASVTLGTFNQLVNAVIEARETRTKDIGTTNFELANRINAMEARLNGLEDRPPSMHYEGIWSGLVNYRKGAVVTHGGSMWHANKPSFNQRPGNGDVAAEYWVLAVKHGQDGRAGKDGRDGRDLR